MVRKILSQLVSQVREGIAWGLAYSPPSRITALLEPLAAEPAPRHSSPPWPEVVAHAETTPAATDVEPSTVAIVVSRVRDGAAMLLFFLWHCEIREELYAWRLALRLGWGL